MTRLTTGFRSICALALLLGCGGGDDRPDVSGTDATDVRQETREAVDAASDYAADQRRRLVARAQRAADDVERQVGDARRDLAELPEDAREELQRAIDRAQRAQRALGQEVDELQEASADRWETTQKRLSSALDELAEARREIAAALAGRREEADAS